MLGLLTVLVLYVMSGCDNILEESPQSHGWDSDDSYAREDLEQRLYSQIYHDTSGELCCFAL